MSFAGQTIEQLRDLHSDFELFQMFGLDMSKSQDLDDTGREACETAKVRRDEDAEGEFGYFGDMRCPLWTNRKRKLTARDSTMPDTIREGITSNPPGSKGRLDALRAYYQREMTADERSPFGVDLAERWAHMAS